MKIKYESWKKVKDKLQAEHPKAKIKYKYKTRQFRIIYPLPKDFLTIKDIKILYK